MSLAKSVDTPPSKRRCLRTPLSSIIDEEKSGQTSNSSKDATTTTATPSTYPSRRFMTQNFLLLWMDGNMDESKEDCQNKLTELRKIVNNINLFKSPDECVDFLSEIDNQKAFMIVTGAIAEQIVPLIHVMPQLDTIYILCDNTFRHEVWSKVCTKVKGVYTQITPIYEALQLAVKQYNEDSIALSFVAVGEGSTNTNSDQLDPSFMYTQIFKEILLEMKYDRQSIENFSSFCRNNDYGPLTCINQFKDEYHSHLAIWWYTRPSFIFSLLNQALRTLQADTLIHMGFFIRDLHRQIEQLHQKQVGSYHGHIFIVYRGQSLSITDFDKLQKTQGGLMSFNNFLSTSKKREVSFGFAEVALTTTEMVGILFQMTIDPSISSTPFAAIDKDSYFKTEEEVLFSMHTVFRIGEIKKLDKNNQLYQVELTLTGDDDQQLRTLTDRIRKDAVGATGWTRLGSLLLRIGQFNKAEELYTALLEQTSDKGEKAPYYNQLGYVKNAQGDCEKAIRYYEKALEIYRKTLSPNHPDLATCYNNIGEVYHNRGEYSKALSLYEKALEICQKTLPSNHPDLATSYNNIGSVFYNMGEQSKALSLYEKTRKIFEETLPPNHPSLATSYNNIGMVYYNMGVYSKALSLYEKAFEIQEKTLPPNHPDLVASYNNIGLVYRNMGEYSKALSFHEKALKIQEKTLPPNHPLLAASCSNIGDLYSSIREYSKALSFHEKALEIRRATLPSNHPSLATSYNNIAVVYFIMENYSKALSLFEHALDIVQRSLPPNHPYILSARKSIEIVKMKL